MINVNRLSQIFSKAEILSVSSWSDWSFVLLDLPFFFGGGEVAFCFARLFCCVWLIFIGAFCGYFCRTTGTPSPMSPTPSPSGSVGSVGSSGSNETMTTPSRNGKPSTGSNAMTSPVNVCMPQKIHSLTQQQILVVNNLVYSQDLWDQAQPLVLEFRGEMTKISAILFLTWKKIR